MAAGRRRLGEKQSVGSWRRGLARSIIAAATLSGAVALAAIAAGRSPDPAGAALILLTTAGPVGIGVWLRSWWWPPLCALPFLALGWWVLEAASGPGGMVGLLVAALGLPLVAAEAAAGVLLGRALTMRLPQRTDG